MTHSRRRFLDSLRHRCRVRAIVIVLSGLLAASGLTAGAPSATERDGLHNPWTKILETHVRNEAVDYAQVEARSKGLLRAYLDALAKVDPAALSRDERLAFYINLYNATMVATVIDRYRADYTPAENEFAVFNEELVRTAKGRISLNALEHDIIRPEFGEPRIHVALVCGAESCPPLVPRAYTADNLDAMLESNMKRFLTDGKRNALDAASKRLELSKLFEWYADDFGGADGIAEYVNAYTETDVSDWTIRFREYSWKLNDAR